MNFLGQGFQNLEHEHDKAHRHTGRRDLAHFYSHIAHVVHLSLRASSKSIIAYMFDRP